MFTRMKLENFKSWQSLDIEMAPLTILFGTNSSGKSSILQAILFLVQGHHDNGPSIEFGENDNSLVNLGNYPNIVFKHDESRTVRIHFDIKPKARWHFATRIDVDVIYDREYKTTSIDHSTRARMGFDEDIVWNDFHYLGPLRYYPQRAYLWSGVVPNKINKDGSNTMAALIQSSQRDSSLLVNVNSWLSQLELVDKFSMKAIDENERFYEAIVEIGDIESALLDTGFGVSQVLPVITLLFFVPEESIVLLEQPELHLHPRAQAHLADLMLHIAEERKLQLIVESHSEHLLRRLQRRIAEPEHEFANPDNIKMYFCDMGENGSTIQEVEVDEYGQIQNWPDKFFGDITGDLEAMTMAALKRSLNGKN